MRPRILFFIAPLALGLATPALAQLVLPANPELVVTRLMSFDRNADGRIVAAELPERMHGVLARGDRSGDGALDRAEVRGLATAPAPQAFTRNVQVGQYGFRDGFDFDTSKHIDGALDDLRLATATKQRALEIARRFIADTDAAALPNLLAALKPLLTEEQMTSFRDAAEGKQINVPALMRDGVTFFGARPDERAGFERQIVRLRAHVVNLERNIETYGLDPAGKEQALAAVRQFQAHTPGRLNEGERTALLGQLQGVLSDEQREDLGAALARRPLAKLNAGVAGGQVFIQGRPALLRPPEPAPVFGIQDLVLRN